MKGVILAGGLGSRLMPLTKITNKHLLPIYDRPMIYYPIETLRNAGIDEILIVTGGNSAGDFLRLLENGDELGVSLSYAYQRGEGGIAAALRLAERFAMGEPICVMLGDNLIERDIRATADAFRSRGQGACILLKEVEDPERFGVAVRDGDRITRIIEKPKDPPSNLAVIGIYMYDNRVFDIIKTLKPSARGELEITDVNNAYIEAGQMSYGMLTGWWTDAGTFDSLLRASHLVAEGGANKVG
ncbi:MAG: sugar phosphate nucleotidyltransferase [Planctomycetota bacterium]|jgi:glucose-1-phosphate thymidylyltransferase